MTDHETPETGHEIGDDTPLGELPAVGETSPGERTDTRTPDTSGTLLSITEAVERYDVSTVTLGRELRAGEIVGASKRPTSKGDAWTIPAASLVAMGYVERAVSSEPHPAPDRGWVRGHQKAVFLLVFLSADTGLGGKIALVDSDRLGRG